MLLNASSLITFAEIPSWAVLKRNPRDWHLLADVVDWEGHLKPQL